MEVTSAVNLNTWIYCKTYSSLICQDCTLKDHPRGHQDHEFDFVNEVVDEEREKMDLCFAFVGSLSSYGCFVSGA